MGQDDPDLGPGFGGRSDQDDEAQVLLRTAGRRVEVPFDRAVRVRQRVREHWQSGVRRRSARRRRTAVAAFCATAALLILMVGPWDRFSGPARPVAPVATVERIDGIVRAHGVDADRARPRALDVDGVIHEGEVVATVASSRASLRLANGVSLRLDTGSEALLHSATVIELLDGALYVDSGEDMTGVEILTSWGTARDIGTRFEVRVSHAALRLRVRAGLVELWRGDQPISARSGTELTVTDDETVSAPVSPFGAEWDWVVDLAPVFEIDGQSLASFLDWASGELGRSVSYADPALAADARETVLHGSIAGLPLADALAVTLTTSGLDHRLEDGALVVLRPTEGPESESLR